MAEPGEGAKLETASTAPPRLDVKGGETAPEG